MSDNQTPSAQQKIREIKQAGFLRGRFAGNHCESCDTNCGRGWWQIANIEHDEWSCLCRDCAYAQIHQYDDFDVDEYIRIANLESSE